MRCICLSMVLVIIYAEFSFSQKEDSLGYKVAVGKEIAISRFDAFHSFYATMSFGKGLDIRPSLGIGIQKTYALQRFHPRFSLGTGFDLFNKNNTFDFGPEIRFSISAYNLNNVTRLSYTDATLGYFLSYGRKWKVTHCLSVGKGLEKQEELDSSFAYWSFNLNLGLAYVL